VAAKGHEQYFVKLKYDGLWEFVEWLDGQGAEMTWSTTAAIKTWSYITGVRQGTSQYIYVNGVLIDSTIELSNVPLPRDESKDFSIGRYIQRYAPEGYACFKGRLDEVRASGVARGPDWIKLCYMNQKQDDALVEMRK
jgi:hypothetical protein